MIVESELPIAVEIVQPNKGDRIVEDANFGTYRLDCLVREGNFLKAQPVKGLSDQVCWVVRLDSGKQGFFDPSICKITERAAASVLVEESKTETPLEPQFKVGDRVYQENPDNTGVINKISRGKALVSVGDRTVIVPIGRLHHCDPNYSPIPKKSEEEIKAEEEAAIAKARGEYLKSQSLQVVESILVEAVKPALVEVVGKEILLPFDHEIPDKEKGDENYTPDYFIEACRNFLGWFDLDPFSNAIAQKSVRAKTFWTKHDNALTKDWTPYLKKFVNPPYSQRLIGKCIDKILEFCAIGETILIVNSSTSAKWFQRCKNACSAYLNPSKRLPFYNPYREIQYLNGTKKRSGNEYDQTVFYFGTRPLEFAKAMEHLGSCSIPIKKLCSSISTGLVENKSVENSVPEQESFAVSISGEAIIYDPNAKPVEIKSGDRLRITENRELYDLLRPICNWYSGRELATFAVNGLGHALSNARQGKINQAVELLTDKLMAEIVKPKPEVKKLREFLANFVPSIDDAELPVFAEGITTEPTKSVANLRMDESKVSVLVEVDQPVLAESDDRRNRTHHQKKKRVSSSGYAYPDKPSESREWFEDYTNRKDQERLCFLKSERDRLISSGASPKGIWIEKSKPAHKPNFVQAVWKSDKPRPEWGDKKSQYIGEYGKDKHKSAIAIHQAGQQLRIVEREIKSIEKKLSKS